MVNFIYAETSIAIGEGGKETEKANLQSFKVALR
jgi:hypothetical protein